MADYRAVVSFTFDDDDLAELAEELGVSPERMNALETIQAELDNFRFSGDVEQLFCDKEPTIRRLSGGITVEINEHED